MSAPPPLCGPRSRTTLGAPVPEFRAEKYWPSARSGFARSLPKIGCKSCSATSTLACSRVPSTLCLRVEKRNATHANILRPSQISDKYFVQTATILCGAHVGRESWGSFAHNITRGRAQHFAVSRCAFRRCHKSRVVRHPAMRRCSPRSHACAFNTRARRTAGAHTHTHEKEVCVCVRAVRGGSQRRRRRRRGRRCPRRDEIHRRARNKFRNN